MNNPGNSSTAHFQAAQRMALIRAQQSMAQQQQFQRQPGQVVQAGAAARPGMVAAATTVAGQRQQGPLIVGGATQPGAGAAVQAGGPRGQLQSTVSQLGRNIVINQPGLGPGVPGSQITVPLTTLQGLQPGQGIPTGQAGHLLVKTETGQYQILKVGHSTAGATPTTPSAVRAAVPATRPAVPTAVSAAASSPSPIAAPTSTAAGAASSGGGGGMGGPQMTPDTAKIKCKNFLATLLRLASEQPPAVANNVRALIQGLIDGRVEPEDFTAKLQRELGSSPQPCLVPFLKKSLPFLQDSLRRGELTIEGVRPPPTRVAAQQPQVMTPVMSQQQQQLRNVRPVMTATQRPQQQSVIQQQQQRQVLVAQQQLRQLTPHTRPAQMRAGVMQQQAATQQFMQQPGGGLQPVPQQPRFAASSVAQTPVTPMAASLPHMSNSAVPGMITAATASKMGVLQPSPLSAGAPAGSLPGALPSALTPSKEKKTANTFSTAGDEDINDVAAMGGVNLAEESQRMQTDLVGSQMRSCKDEVFLQTGNLSSRVAKLCAARGLDEPGPEVMALMSHATQDRLKTLLEKLSVIAEHRMDVIRLEGDAYEVTQDVKGQVRFLSDLDRLEKTRHEQAERQRLMMAARSRTKTDDPEKEKLKAQAKEMQRMEEEQMLQEKANTTALMAIGGSRKKIRLDETGAAAAAAMGVHGGMGHSAASSVAQAQLLRPKTKRVHQRDLMFLMEQEKDLKRSPTLWKAYIS